MTKFKLVSLLALISISSCSQEKNTDTIDKQVATFCECANKAKDLDEFNTCGEKLNALATVTRTASDSLYLTNALKSQCGDVFKKRLEPKQVDPAPTLINTFLNEADLNGLQLQKGTTTRNTIQWTGKSQDQVIKSLREQRELFSSDSLAAVAQEKQKSKMLSENYKKVQLQENSLELLQVYSFRLYGDYHMIQVYARKNNLTCFTMLTVYKNDKRVLNDLFIKLNERISNFNKQ
jgi:hypothetical protein